MRLTNLFWSLPLVFSSPLVDERNNWDSNTGNGILNDTYPHVKFGQSREYINQYAKQSIQSLVSAVNHTNGQFLDGIINPVGRFFFWQSNNGWTGVAQYDHQQNTQDFFIDYYSAQNSLAKYPGDSYETWGVALVNTFNDDAGWAALSSLTACEAYGHPIFLKRAIDIWNFVSDHGYIDQKVIDTGYLKGTKNSNITLSSECNGKSMLGGVYWVNGGPQSFEPGFFDAASNPNVNAVSTGNYALLSVELCRLTGDMDYCDRAYQNAWWLDDHMVSPEGLLWDNYNGTDCTLQNNTWTYNTGLYIAVYAGLGHLTGNATATRLAERAAIAAMNTGVWNTAEGIINEAEGSATASDDAIGFKSILIRYLAKAHPWLSDEGVKAAIVQYINIQYWALTTLSSDAATHPIRYGRNWTGPAFNVSSQHAQLAALDVSNGIHLNPDSAFPDTEDRSSPVAYTEGKRQA